MCLGFEVGVLGSGQTFFILGFWAMVFCHWHFVRYQAAYLEKPFGGTVDRKDYSTETKAKAAFRQTVF